MIDFSQRRALLSWQFLFISFATSWLWAPQLNNVISYRSSLISQYETDLQPYGWLFRIGDVLAALLLGLIAAYYIRHKSRTAGWMLAVIAAGAFLDPVLTTNCQLHSTSCIEHESISFVLHATETVLTAAAILTLTMYDVLKRRRIVSLLFLLFQPLYMIFSLTHIATINNFNTLTQIIYQVTVYVWIAWYCRDNLTTEKFMVKNRETHAVRYIAATWGVLNGLLALLLSFYHGGILGHLDGLYFVGKNEILAQYAIFVGVAMLYLSRHLWRGEERARQIFLLLIGIETINYSVVTPNPGLLAFYFFSFCALFVLQDDFDRGVVPLQLRIRLKEALLLTSILLGAGVSLIILLYFTHRRVTVNSIDHFFDYTIGTEVLPHVRQRSVIVAHLLSGFIIASLAAVLWTLFRPIRPRHPAMKNDANVKTLLEKYSSSVEDYFKIWPKDKQYFWSDNHDGYVSYKVVGSVAFALADPITAPSKKTALIDAFIVWARAHRLTTCFVPIYTEKSRELYETAGLQTLQMGSSAVINCAEFNEVTSKDKWWRWQKNRAHKAGYTYHVSLPPHSADFIRQLKAVSDEWLAVGGHTERSFALGYFDSVYLHECTVHYLKDENADIVAFANQLPAYNGVKTSSVDLLRYRPSANNTMPFLLSNTILSVAENGSTHFDLGFVPFAASDEGILKIAKIIASARFSSAGLEQFKNKFDPVWRPTYLAYDGDLADLARVAVTLESAMKP